MGDVTQLIARARAGVRSALDALFELLHLDLRRIAHARLSGHARSQQIETMALVNEGHLKFVQMARLHPVDRNHFLAYSATVMRSIIVNTVRASQAERRGGGVRLVTLSTSVGEQVALPEDKVLDMHAALQALAAPAERLARVAEMRYFCGPSDGANGAVLGVTDRTVLRDWEKASLLLADALRSRAVGRAPSNP